jgi:glycerophosphoryl diester phosphodiesterase
MSPPLLIGHRGARGLFPENTIEGFTATVALGVDAIELDVGVTADGVPVVCHDPALNPDLVRAGGAWLAARGKLIRHLTAGELAAYDVGRARPGSPTAVANPEQSPADGARIPRLDRVLAATDTHLIVELKTLADQPDWTVSAPEMAQAVVDAADRAGAAARITVESFDWRGPRYLRRTRPDIQLAWLTRAATVAEARLWWDGPSPADFGGSVPRAVAAEGGPCWAPEHAGLTPELIGEAHELGLRVLAWTVNRPEDMRRLIGWGIDGLITDRPDLARRVMCAAGLPLPVPA